MKRIIVILMVLLMLVTTALADERIDLSTDGYDQIMSVLELPDGRVVFAGRASVKGNYQDSRARLFCMNPDGTVVWDYRHSDEGNCSFSNLQLLPEGVMGVIFQNSYEQSTRGTWIMRFSLDGEPVGEPIDIFEEHITSVESTHDCISYAVIDPNAQIFYRYFVDWNGNILFCIHSDSNIGGGSMLPVEDGILLIGNENGYPALAKAFKLDMYGNAVWETVLPIHIPDGDAVLSPGITAPDGGVVAWLWEIGENPFSNERQEYRALVRFDKNGNVLWQTQVTPEMYDHSRCNDITIWQNKIVVAMPCRSYDGRDPYVYLWFDMNGMYLGQTSHRLEAGEVNYGAAFVTLNGELWVKKDITTGHKKLMDEMDSCDEVLIRVPVI